MPTNTIDKASPTSNANQGSDEYTLLRDMILREQLMPNERLVEQDYAERFGTSRSNIRKALARLEQEGLVVQKPFHGARVRHITVSEAVEMFEIREALEVMLMKHVCERITEPDKKELKVLVQKMREAARTKDHVGVSLTSRRLREELWRISGHATCTKLLSNLKIQLVRLWYKTTAMPGRADAIVVELSAVVDAVCAASTSNAVKAMRRYHEAAIANLKRSLSVDERIVP